MTIKKQDLARSLDNSAAPTEVSISGTSAQSAALDVGSYIITSDVDCYFLQGSNPTALTTSRKLWANTYRRIDVTSSGDKIAGITGGASGTLSIEKVQ